MNSYTQIDLPEGKFLADIEPFKSIGIPTNSFVHKIIPAAGITHYAIRFFCKNLLMAEPNVPVIQSKVKEHNDKYPEQKILGVYKGIEVEDIKEYLLSDVEYKKILTTPEGFISKVLKAFEGNEDTLYNDYFLLFDECERLVTDVSYRGAIAAPLNVFFNFKEKALVSATTLPFSSELFKNFNHYVVKPGYNYDKPLTLVNTNNTIAALSKVLDEITTDHVFIFLNSTNGIKAIVEELNIQKESMVFCSQDSVLKLLLGKFKNASSDFDSSKIKKYNFFTSRYFSAIDLKFDFPADVIMVSDMVFAKHSMLDPHTEVIQIVGRFRNGVNSVTHIAAYDDEIEVMSQAEALRYFEGCLDLHEEIVRLLEKDKKKSSVDMLKFINEHSPVASFYSNGKRNSFMLDNALNEARVLNYYKEYSYLEEAYREVSNHFKLTIESDIYPISDKQIRNLYSLGSKRETWKEAARMIEMTKPREGVYKLTSPYLLERTNKLSTMFPFINEAVDLIGLDGLSATEYKKSEIHKAVAKARKQEAIDSLRPQVEAAFPSPIIIPETEMKAKLEQIAAQNNYKYDVPASLIQKFFNATRTQMKGANAWNIGDKIIYSIQEK